MQSPGGPVGQEQNRDVVRRLRQSTEGFLGSGLGLHRGHAETFLPSSSRAILAASPLRPFAPSPAHLPSVLLCRGDADCGGHVSSVSRQRRRQTPRRRRRPAARHPGAIRGAEPAPQAGYGPRGPRRRARPHRAVFSRVLHRGPRPSERTEWFLRPLVAILRDLPAAGCHRDVVCVCGRRHCRGVPRRRRVGACRPRYLRRSTRALAAYPEGHWSRPRAQPLFGMHRSGVQHAAARRHGSRGRARSGARIGHAECAVAADDRHSLHPPPRCESAHSWVGRSVLAGPPGRLGDPPTWREWREWRERRRPRKRRGRVRGTGSGSGDCHLVGGAADGRRAMAALVRPTGAAHVTAHDRGRLRQRRGHPGVAARDRYLLSRRKPAGGRHRVDARRSDQRAAAVRDPARRAPADPRRRHRSGRSPAVRRRRRGAGYLPHACQGTRSSRRRRLRGRHLGCRRTRWLRGAVVGGAAWARAGGAATRRRSQRRPAPAALAPCPTPSCWPPAPARRRCAPTRADSVGRTPRPAMGTPWSVPVAPSATSTATVGKTCSCRRVAPCPTGCT